MKRIIQQTDMSNAQKLDMILNTKSKTPKRYTGKLPSLNCTVENDGKPKGSKIADYMD